MIQFNKSTKGMKKLHFWGELLNLLDTQMTEPTIYGWFHLLFIAITITATIVMCQCFKNPSEKTTRKILFVFAAISIVLEVYKQINYTFTYDGNKIITDYQWYAFPFQFCSTPMYVALLASFIKQTKLHNALCAYLATFSVFAGLCVYAYPEQVFIGTIGINIQTMVCHGAMIVIGIWLLYCNYIKSEHKTILYATPVFAVMIILAMIMNDVANQSGLLTRESFNMFYISPHCEPSLPVYSLVQEVVPYPFCLIIYLVAFSLAAYIILLISILLKKHPDKNKVLEKEAVLTK